MTDTAARDFDQDLKVLLDGIDARLPKPLPEWPGGYPGQVEAALIDAVLSIRARYGKQWQLRRLGHDSWVQSSSPS